MLTSYVQVVNPISTTFAMDYIIAETDTEIVQFTQPANESALQYADALWIKILWYSQVYDEYILMGMFVEGLAFLKMHRMRSFWSSNNHAALRKLAYIATSFTNLEETCRGLDTSNRYKSPPNGNKWTKSRLNNERRGNVNSMLSWGGGRENRM